jgi:hypothetical protein
MKKKCILVLALFLVLAAGSVFSINIVSSERLRCIEAINPWGYDVSGNVSHVVLYEYDDGTFMIAMYMKDDDSPTNIHLIEGRNNPGGGMQYAVSMTYGSSRETGFTGTARKVGLVTEIIIMKDGIRHQALKLMP